MFGVESTLAVTSKLCFLLDRATEDLLSDVIVSFEECNAERVDIFGPDLGPLELVVGEVLLILIGLRSAC